MLDHYSVHVHNNQQVAALPQLDRGSDYESERHRFESYTPHHLRLKLPATGAFLLRKHCMDSNLGRGEGVKKTRSVLARGRARRQAAEAGADPRSGCAESYTPHHLNLKPPATGAFLLWRHPMDSNLSQRGLFLIDSCKISNMRLGGTVARSFFRRPIRVIFRGRASDIQAQVSRSQKALSGHA